MLSTSHGRPSTSGIRRASIFFSAHIYVCFKCFIVKKKIPCSLRFLQGWVFLLRRSGVYDEWSRVGLWIDRQDEIDGVLGIRTKREINRMGLCEGAWAKCANSVLKCAGNGDGWICTLRRTSQILAVSHTSVPRVVPAPLFLVWFPPLCCSSTFAILVVCRFFFF